ncbi:hypothetical protein CAter282_0214 [Collimonas arenae]|uniref:Uncharacterized protein n=1 Tax=Collimonas arenae TaxID=279058 RepID=A0A127PK56_9BURK|nr:hypothetical protein CAter10_0227 [Collimonas arenae]AMP08038.1 hypothetical protein CAter282_0214 [Collimonas arenae]
MGPTRVGGLPAGVLKASAAPWRVAMCAIRRQCFFLEKDGIFP